MKLFSFVCLAWLCWGRVLLADTNIIAEGASLEKLADGFIFTEGAACDPEGNVFFTDQPNDRILKWSTDGKLSTFMQPCGRANGLCFDREGALWACADEKNELWRIEPGTDKHIVVVRGYKGKLLNGPNDIWIRADGGIYLTDPYYKRAYWKRGARELPEQVYYLGPERKALTPVIEDMSQPNGIIGTPDDKLLYVSDIRGGKTFRYRIQPDGGLTEKSLFCELGSDGMTIDSEGNVYLTGNGVSVFAPSGAKLAHIDVAEKWTGNICFGGKERHTLFITASKGLYSLKMRVHGVGSQ